jgi:hypothetical protein
MIFFKRKTKNTNFKMTNFKDFEFTSYLSPWYFKDYIPNISKDLKWKYFDQLPMTKLLLNDVCFGLVDTYCYIKPISTENFLIWVRGTTKIELYKTQDLKPIYNDTDIIKHIKDKKTKYYFDCSPIDQIEYFFDLYQTEINFDFPESFNCIDEIIQVNDIDGMYSDYKQGMHNTAIVVLQPNNNKIFLYPQDWFNKDEKVDFGYEWITRADRNKLTGKIQIQGIRIVEQVLDKTNRQIEK